MQVESRSDGQIVIRPEDVEFEGIRMTLVPVIEERMENGVQLAGKKSQRLSNELAVTYHFFVIETNEMILEPMNHEQIESDEKLFGKKTTKFWQEYSLSRMVFLCF